MFKQSPSSSIQCEKASREYSLSDDGAVFLLASAGARTPFGNRPPASRHAFKVS